MKKVFKLEWEGEANAICKAVLEALIYREYETGRRLQRVKVTELFLNKFKDQKLPSIDKTFYKWWKNPKKP